MNSHRQPRNSLAIASFAAGILTLFSLCVGIAPIPLTGYVCFPATAILALTAVITGLRGLRDSGMQGATGRTMALAGILIGSVVMACGLSMAALGVVLWPQLLHLAQSLGQ